MMLHLFCLFFLHSVFLLLPAGFALESEDLSDDDVDVGEQQVFRFLFVLKSLFWSFIRVVALCASHSQCTHSAQWCEATVARNQNQATRGRNMKQKPTTKRLLIIFLKGTEKNFT